MNEIGKNSWTLILGSVSLCRDEYIRVFIKQLFFPLSPIAEYSINTCQQDLRFSLQKVPPCWNMRSFICRLVCSVDIYRALRHTRCCAGHVWLHLAGPSLFPSRMAEKITSITQNTKKWCERMVKLRLLWNHIFWSSLAFFHHSRADAQCLCPWLSSLEVICSEKSNTVFGVANINANSNVLEVA